MSLNFVYALLTPDRFADPRTAVPAKITPLSVRGTKLRGRLIATDIDRLTFLRSSSPSPHAMELR